jgi:hypothetical protein
MIAVPATICDRCGEKKPISANLDGDNLCRECVDLWVRGEGEAQRLERLEQIEIDKLDRAEELRK